MTEGDPRKPLDVAVAIGQLMGVPVILTAIGVGLLAASYAAGPLEGVGSFLVAGVCSWMCMVSVVSLVMGVWVAIASSGEDER